MEYLEKTIEKLEAQLKILEQARPIVFDICRVLDKLEERAKL